MTYDLGDEIRVSAEFLDSDGDAFDPTTVLFAVRKPGGKLVQYTYGVHGELVKDSTGNYHVDVDGDLAGTWFYRFYATGTGKSAQDGQFIVKASKAILKI